MTGMVVFTTHPVPGPTPSGHPLLTLLRLVPIRTNWDMPWVPRVQVSLTLVAYRSALRLVGAVAVQSATQASRPCQYDPGLHPTSSFTHVHPLIQAFPVQQVVTSL